LLVIGARQSSIDLAGPFEGVLSFSIHEMAHHPVLDHDPIPANHFAAQNSGLSALAKDH
jgi:hypothetical protein